MRAIRHIQRVTVRRGFRHVFRRDIATRARTRINYDRLPPRRRQRLAGVTAHQLVVDRDVAVHQAFGQQRLLSGRQRAGGGDDDGDDVDGNLETTRLLRSQLRNKSNLRVIDAVKAALDNNVSVGGIHPAEATLARLMCERFGIDRVRFTNSGTEATLMAITVARASGVTKSAISRSIGVHCATAPISRSRISRACPRPKRSIRFTAMLYVGRKLEFSG